MCLNVFCCELTDFELMSADEERVRLLQNLVVLAKPEAPTLASTPEPSSEYTSLASYLAPYTTPGTPTSNQQNALHVHVRVCLSSTP